MRDRVHDHHFHLGIPRPAVAYAILCAVALVWVAVSALFT